MAQENKKLNQLIALRNEKKLNQETIADIIGIARETYGKYEKGSSVVPSDILEKISDYFGVSTDYILGRTKYKTASNDLIGNLTGLNDSAVKVLVNDHSKKNQTGIGHIVDCINFLLSNEDGIELIDDIFNYLFGNYVMTVNDETTIAISDGMSISVNENQKLFPNSIGVSINRLNIAFLMSVIEMLSVIKNDIENNPQYDNYGKVDLETASDSVRKYYQEIIAEMNEIPDEQWQADFDFTEELRKIDPASEILNRKQSAPKKKRTKQQSRKKKGEKS